MINLSLVIFSRADTHTNLFIYIQEMSHIIITNYYSTHAYNYFILFRKPLLFSFVLKNNFVFNNIYFQ